MGIIIGVGHRSRHGKDTFCNYFIEYANLMRPDLTIKKLSWAWKLKDVCHQLYAHLGLREPEFYETPEGAALRDVKLPAIGKTPVEIWIDMGTPAVREQVWDRTWISWVLDQASRHDVVVCPDTRFHNEIEACDWTIKVHDPRKPPREGKSVDDVLADYTDWDFVVENNLGHSELRGHANVIADQLLSDYGTP